MAPRAEDQIQIAIVALLAFYENQRKLTWFAIPNGEKRDAITGAKLKRTGTRAGVPDLLVLFPGGRTLFLEVKADKGKLSGVQAEWFHVLRKLDHTAAVVRNIDQAKKCIDLALAEAA